jgi:predicted alpha/beta hydrolase family esterase
MKRVLILYGWQGSDTPHWQDWLAKELTHKGYEVSFPQLSNNQKPQKELWMSEATAAFDAIKPDIVITHSMGGILWFHLCNEGLVTSVENLLLVAPPRDLSDFEDVKTFFPVEVPSQHCAKQTLMICSDNDPYMDLDESKKLAKRLGAPLKVLENAGHINSDSGFGPWPWVLDYICGLDEAVV